MPYISEGQHITSPVSIRDVQRCLGSSSNDLATLCMRPNINMWSVSKPIYFAKVGQLTDAEMKTGRGVIDGYTISYGIKKRSSSTWSDYINTSTGEVKSAVWSYDKPVVDGVNVFRLTDFYNYWHNARCAMVISLDPKEKVVVPASVSGTGDVLKYSLNFLYMLYSSGCISSQMLFGDCANYYPSIILTCYYSGGAWQYVKSSDLKISEIGASSAQSGTDINIDTVDLVAAMVHDGARYESDCFINGRTWAACMVLLSDKVAGSTTAHTVGNKTIVRLEYEAGVDRNTFTITSGKFRYISAMSIAVTLKKDTVNSGWYYIDSITVTATKVNNTQMPFTIKASLTCVIGTVGVSGVAADAPTVNVSNYSSTTFAAQSGSVTNTLSFNRTTYKPTSPADPSGSLFCTGRLTFENQYGDWEGTFTIDVKSGSSTYYRTVQLS